MYSLLSSESPGIARGSSSSSFCSSSADGILSLMERLCNTVQAATILAHFLGLHHTDPPELFRHQKRDFKISNICLMITVVLVWFVLQPQVGNHSPAIGKVPNRYLLYKNVNNVHKGYICGREMTPNPPQNQQREN